MKHSLFFISLAAALAALCSCGKDTKTPDIHDLDLDDIFITSTSLSPAGPLTMYVGESVTITASYEPADATLTDLLWKNGDEKVLEMVPSQDSRSVTVKAISAGEAVLLLNAPLPSDGSIINSGSSIWITVIRPRSDEVAERLRIEGDETVQASAKPLILGLSLRNLAHVFLFFLLGFCAFQVMEKAIPAGIFGYAYAVLDEIHQQFSGRHARWQDTLIDLAGVVLGIALALTARYMIRKIRKGDPL